MGSGEVDGVSRWELLVGAGSAAAVALAGCIRSRADVAAEIIIHNKYQREQ
jgi:hypothetical protein